VLCRKKNMKTSLFETFVEMINGIPAAGILKAIELEHGMLEDDLLHKRIPETLEVNSILCFCQFIKAVRAEGNTNPVVLPTDHIAFYRKVVTRLIEAGKLPLEAKRQFDLKFSPSFLKALVS